MIATAQRRRRSSQGQLGFEWWETNPTFNNPYNPAAGGTPWWNPNVPNPVSPGPFGNQGYNWPAPGTPVYTGGGTTPNIPIGQPQPIGSGNGMTIFNNISSLVSQILAGWSQNPTNQIYAPGVTPLNNPTVQMQQAQAAALIAQSQNVPRDPRTGQPYAYGSSPGGALGGGLDGIITWATQNPLIVFIAIGGVILLFRQPPGKK